MISFPIVKYLLRAKYFLTLSKQNCCRSLEDYELLEYEGKETASDPILQYLRRYYLQLDQLDSSPEPDLSWDEADLPQLRPQVWTFNDFMEQYNNIYSWLNNIQVEYHSNHSSHKDFPLRCLDSVDCNLTLEIQ